MVSEELHDASDKICRVCRETSDTDAMISPCGCRGTMAWIHRECWLQGSERCVPCGINMPSALQEPNEVAIDPVAVFATIAMRQLSPRIRMGNLIVDAIASPFGRWFIRIMAAHIVLACLLQLIILARMAFA